MPCFQANWTLKPNQISSQVKCLVRVQDVISSQVKCLMIVQDVISSQVGMIRSIFTWILMTQWLASNSEPFIVFSQVMDV